jgi:hypothetical protein
MYMYGVLRGIQWLGNNPYVNIGVGLVLLLTGLSEAWGTWSEDLRHMHLQGHHGLIIFGLFHLLKTLPDLFEGIERLNLEAEQDTAEK